MHSRLPDDSPSDPCFLESNAGSSFAHLTTISLCGAYTVAEELIGHWDVISEIRLVEPHFSPAPLILSRASCHALSSLMDTPEW